MQSGRRGKCPRRGLNARALSAFPSTVAAACKTGLCLRFARTRVGGARPIGPGRSIVRCLSLPGECLSHPHAELRPSGTGIPNERASPDFNALSARPFERLCPACLQLGLIIRQLDAVVKVLPMILMLALSLRGCIPILFEVGQGHGHFGNRHTLLAVEVRLAHRQPTGNVPHLETTYELHFQYVV